MNTRCFACEFGRALLISAALMLALIVVASVCITGARGEEVLMNADPSHNTMSTRDFVIVLVAAVAAAVMVVVANSRGDRA